MTARPGRTGRAPKTPSGYEHPVLVFDQTNPLVCQRPVLGGSADRLVRLRPPGTGRARSRVFEQRFDEPLRALRKFEVSRTGSASS